MVHGSEKLVTGLPAMNERQKSREMPKNLDPGLGPHSGTCAHDLVPATPHHCAKAIPWVLVLELLQLPTAYRISPEPQLHMADEQFRGLRDKLAQLLPLL